MNYGNASNPDSSGLRMHPGHSIWCKLSAGEDVLVGINFSCKTRLKWLYTMGVLEN
jgi:hypothetical protein